MFLTVTCRKYLKGALPFRLIIAMIIAKGKAESYAIKLAIIIAKGTTEKSAIILQ